MILVDDRTEDQKETHTLIVMMTDSFMSGWGEAAGGPSYAGWACKPENVRRMEERIEGRSDAKRVRVVGGDYRPPSGPGHCHIYLDDFAPNEDFYG